MKQYTCYLRSDPEIKYEIPAKDIESAASAFIEKYYAIRRPSYKKEEEIIVIHNLQWWKFVIEARINVWSYSKENHPLPLEGMPSYLCPSSLSSTKRDLLQFKFWAKIFDEYGPGFNWGKYIIYNEESVEELKHYGITFGLFDWMLHNKKYKASDEINYHRTLEKVFIFEINQEIISQYLGDKGTG